MCKGQFYRGIVEKYVDNKGCYVFRTKLVPLLRKSCKDGACGRCLAIERYMEDVGIEDAFDDDVNIDQVENGGEYKLIIHSELWESMYGAEYDERLELHKVKDEVKQ